MWLGNQLVVVLTDPKDVQVVMTDIRLISKSLEYKYIEPWLGTGLLTSTNKKWTTRRKILTPAFHFKILDDFIEVFDKQGNILVEKLKDKSGKNSFDIFPPVALSALDIICGNVRNLNFELNYLKIFFFRNCNGDQIKFAT